MTSSDPSSHFLIFRSFCSTSPFDERGATPDAGSDADSDPEPSRDLRGGQCPAHPVGLAAAREQDHRRDATDVVARRQAGQRLGVDLGHDRAPAPVLGEALELGGHHAAGPAPRRPEVDHDGQGRVAQELVELRRGADRDGVVGEGALAGAWCRNRTTRGAPVLFPSSRYVRRQRIRACGRRCLRLPTRTTSALTTDLASRHCNARHEVQRFEACSA